jgi:hypothetical protein
MAACLTAMLALSAPAYGAPITSYDRDLRVLAEALYDSATTGGVSSAYLEAAKTRALGPDATHAEAMAAVGFTGNSKALKNKWSIKTGQTRLAEIVFQSAHGGVWSWRAERVFSMNDFGSDDWDAVYGQTGWGDDANAITFGKTWGFLSSNGGLSGFGGVQGESAGTQSQSLAGGTSSQNQPNSQQKTQNEEQSSSQSTEGGSQQDGGLLAYDPPFEGSDGPSDEPIPINGDRPEPVAVPLPATGWLLLIGLAGLLAARRRVGA